ncbi:MAG: glycosyltransferase family 2 protein [Planctomycetota bacterium]
MSILVPVFNEEATLETVVDKIAEVDFPVDIEIVMVDDGSQDATPDLIQELKLAGKIDVAHSHEVNRGKGAAIQSALLRASGDWVVIQDADLEYDPHEIPRLLEPVLEGRADVVYGSRFAGSGPHRVLYFWHRIANQVLTTVSNMFTNLNLTDMETCYKLFDRSLLDGVELCERRFGIEPELTARFAAVEGVRIYEVGISYAGRTYAEGKKIGWKDGVAALKCIVKYWRRAKRDRRRASSRAETVSVV